MRLYDYWRSSSAYRVRIALRQDRLAALMALAEERGDDRDRLARIMQRMQYQGAGT